MSGIPPTDHGITQQRPEGCDHDDKLMFDGEEWYCPECHAEALDQEDWEACHQVGWAYE